jgi:hypothetical protein
VPPTKEEEVVADTEAVPAGEVPTAADTEAAAGEGEGELKDGEKS